MRSKSYSLFESIFSVTPKVTETKFRNFEKKIATARIELIRAGVSSRVVEQSLADEVFEFMQKDGCNPNPRGRQPFRISEFEKEKIGFYAKFLTRTSVADAFHVCTASVKTYELAYKFPRVE